MKYIVYLTTNIVNQKIYIGVHGTEDPNVFDGYIGNSCNINYSNTYNRRETPFQCAVAKYGPKNFKRKVLQVFDTVQEALALEKELVNEEFIKRTDTYNITLGGGMPPINKINIFQYDLEGNFIKIWESVKSVTDYYHINKDRLRMVIDEKRSMAASYWTDEYFEWLDISEYRASARSYIRVFSPDGVLLYTFKSNAEAVEQLGLTKNIVQNAVQRKTLSHGYYFLKDGDNIRDVIRGNIKELPIHIYKSSGEYIETIETLHEVKKKYNYNKNEIKRAIKNDSLFEGYYWSYDKYNNILLENPNYEKKTPRKVYQYTLEGEFVREWESITACRKYFPAVLQVCLGNRNHCKKFKFSFDEVKDIV